MPAFKVLAIDGGGIRGIMPARVLKQIEDRIGRCVAEAFDLVAGTSTGGIIALGLTKPDSSGQPAKKAQDIIQLYEDEGARIFPRSFLQGLQGLVRGPKYTADGIDGALQRQFDTARLKDAVKPVLVSSYDIERQTPMFFKSAKAKADPTYDFAMADVARATSAAPTYFPPEKIGTSPLEYYALVDGGVVAGNPAMCAYAEAISMGAAPNDLLVVSLGTGDLPRPIAYADAVNWGQLEWAQPIIDMVLQASNDAVDYQLRQLLVSTGPDRTYFRFQPQLTPNIGAMDDARDSNMKALCDVIDNYLAQPEIQDSFNQLCARLTT